MRLHLRITERTARIIISWAAGVLAFAGFLVLLFRSADPARLLIWLVGSIGLLAVIWTIAWAIVSEHEARTPFEQEWPQGDAEREARRPQACQLTDGVRPCCSLEVDAEDLPDAMHTALIRHADEVTGHLPKVTDE